jgi:hypothetical protein
MATETRTITATIARVNGSGFQTQEHPGKWLNLSRYATPPPTIPAVGEEVLIALDGAGYLRAIEPVARAEPPTSVVEPPSTAFLKPRDTAIVRSNALMCAVKLLGSPADIGETLKLAARLEAWCLGSRGRGERP